MKTHTKSVESVQSLKSVVKTINTKRWGFNELQRRQDDLCNLLKNGCTGVTTISLSDLLRTLSFIPLPTKSH